MRRKDRELTEQAEILRLLARCDTVRLGLWDGTRPYVVPVSFGLAPDALQPLLYFSLCQARIQAGLPSAKPHCLYRGGYFLQGRAVAHGHHGAL